MWSHEKRSGHACRPARGEGRSADLEIGTGGGDTPPQNADLKVSATKAASSEAAPPDAQKPINQIQVFALLAGQVPSHRVAILVQERGIDFEPDDEYLREVRLAGGEDELVSALKGAKVTKPEQVYIGRESEPEMEIPL